MFNNDNYKYSELTEQIIGQVYVVFNTLGHGFLEKIYRKALVKRLRAIGLKAEEEYPIKVFFEGENMGDYYSDIFGEDKVMVELKAAESLNSGYEAQLINYLKATGNEVGLLINFGKKLEIKRKVFSVNHPKSAPVSG